MKTANLLQNGTIAFKTAIERAAGVAQKNQRLKGFCLRKTFQMSKNKNNKERKPPNFETGLQAYLLSSLKEKQTHKYTQRPRQKARR